MANTPPDLVTHWRVRRYTMFACLVLGVLFAIFFSILEILRPNTIAAITSVIGWLYSMLSVAVIGYYSNTAVEEYVKNRKH